MICEHNYKTFTKYHSSSKHCQLPYGQWNQGISWNSCFWLRSCHHFILLREGEILFHVTTTCEQLLWVLRVLGVLRTTFEEDHRIFWKLLSFLLQKLQTKYTSDEQAFIYLQNMVFQEMKSNTCTAKNSSTDALLWLKRYTTLLMLFSYLLVSLWNENKEKLYETLTLSQNFWGKFILQNINFKN